MNDSPGADFLYSPKCSTLANVGRSNIYKNKKDYSDVRKIRFFYFDLLNDINMNLMGTI